MKFISAIILIIFFLFKTGNVLSNNSIFHVNNIEIDNKYYKNKDKFFNQLFKEGFDQLSKKILLKKDYQKLQSLSIKEIKNLISHYEIVEPKKNGEPISSNIFFDRTKLNTFFFKNKIAYCDFDDTEIHEKYNMFTQRQTVYSATNFLLSDKLFTQRQTHYSATNFLLSDDISSSYK